MGKKQWDGQKPPIYSKSFMCTDIQVVLSAYFLHTFIWKNHQFGRHSAILLQYNLDFSHISEAALMIFFWGGGGGLKN